MNINKWQDKFFAQPFVWGLIIEGEVDSLYDTEVGVDYALAFALKRQERARKQRMHIHSEELARVRWVEGFTR